MMAAAAVAELTAIGCKTTPSAPAGAGVSTFAGVVSVGAPVRGSLRVESLGDNAEVLAPHGTGVSDENGRFSLSVVTPERLGRICAQGEFIDPATGAPLRISEMCSIVYLSSSVDHISVNPWTHLVQVRAGCLTHKAKLSPEDAYATAKREMNTLLACQTPTMNVVDAIPATVEPGTDAEIHAGLVTAGLSQLAVELSTAMGYTPGKRLTIAQLLAGLAQDVANDCEFDGMNEGQPIFIEGYPLAANTLRSETLGLAHGVRDFVTSESNHLGLSIQDIKDFLICLSHEPFDSEGPTVAILSPPAGSVMAGEIKVSCAASDPSSIKPNSMRIWARKAGQETTVEANLLSTPSEQAQATANERTATASLSTQSISDGSLELYCSAKDGYMNESTVKTQVTLSNVLPTVEITTPTAGAVLKGKQDIVCRCLDPIGGVCELATPVPSAANVVVVAGTATGEVHAIWDTTAEPEGTYVVECRSKGVRTASTAIPVVIDNLAEGTLSGRVSMETPVEGGLVEALSFAGGVRGSVLGTAATDDRDGTFRMRLPDTYRGPIMLRVTQGAYLDAATNQSVVFSKNDELLLLFDYTPTTTGTVIADAHVSALTTLATMLAEAYVAEEKYALPEAIVRAYQLFGQHLERTVHPEGIAVGRTRVSDFSPGRDPSAQGDPEESLRLGLFHVGLSRWAATKATIQSLSSSTFTAMSAVGLFGRDLRDGVLDGRANEDQLFPTPTRDLPQALTVDALRAELATSLATWLDSRPLPDGSIIPNGTTLRSSHFSQSNGFFDVLSLDRSELFEQGERAYAAFDREGPEVVSIDGSPTTAFTDKPVSGSLSIAAKAIDLGVGFDAATEMNLAIDGNVLATVRLPTEYGQSTVRGDFTIDTTKLLDGNHIVEIVATDLLGNKGTSGRIPIIVDNTPPLLGVQCPKLVRGNSVVVTAQISENVGPQTVLKFLVAGVIQATISTAGTVVTQNLSIACTGTEAGEEIKVVATDMAGHESTWSDNVRCDNIPPSIELLQSLYKQESLSNGQTSGVLFNLQGVSEVDMNSLAGQDITQSKIVKKFRIRYNESTNVPRLSFKISDIAPSQDPVSYLKVTYDVAIGPNATRRSTPIVCARNYCELPLTPMSLGLLERPLDVDILPTHSSIVISLNIGDAAGNTTTTAYQFSLVLLDTPVVVDDCSITPALMEKSVSRRTMHTAYNGLSTNVLGCKLFWAGNGGTRQAVVRFNGASASTTVLSTRRVRLTTNPSTSEVWWGPRCRKPGPTVEQQMLAEWCQTSGPQHYLSYDHSCTVGTFPNVQNVRQELMMAEHDVLYVIDGKIASSGDAIVVDPGQTHSVFVRMINSEVKKPSGESYRWGISEPGYLASGPHLGRELTKTTVLNRMVQCSSFVQMGQWGLEAEKDVFQYGMLVTEVDIDVEPPRVEVDAREGDDQSVPLVMGESAKRTHIYRSTLENGDSAAVQ